MSHEARRSLIESIENKRGSKVIAYITSDRTNLSHPIDGEAISIIHDHLRLLDQDGFNKIDLYLYSRGGLSDIPWTLVSMFRQYCQNKPFCILIPYRAHSAATAICLGADEIIMTKKAELGPIDATIPSGPYNPVDANTHNRLPVSVEDVNSYFALHKRVGCGKPEERKEGFKQLTAQVHPLALGAVNRIVEQTKLIGRRLLDTRSEPFSRKHNEKIIKRLSSEVYSHAHAINRTEAIQNIGLKQVRTAESQNIEGEMWALYESYRDYFDLERPFKPEEFLIANDKEENSWDDLPVACIESVNRMDVFKRSIQVKRLRKVPPTININLSQIAFPPISIPSLPPTITPQVIEGIVKTAVSASVQLSLNQAVVNATNIMLKSLPQVGFQYITFKSGWIKEA